MRPTRTTRIAIPALLLGSLLLLNACSDDTQPGGANAKGGPPGAMALPVEVAAAYNGVVKRSVNAVGSLRANESVVIRSEIAGRIMAIHFTEGDSVKAGVELIRLDDSEQRAQLAQSAAMVRLNQLNFDRARDVLQKKLLSQQNYDEAQENLRSSQAQLALAEARLAKTRLTAPFAGILGLRQVSVGDYVKEGQDIVNLEDIQTLKLDFRIPENYLASVKPEQETVLQVDAYPAQRFSGSIYAIDPRVDEQTRTLLLRARVPNPDQQLRPGMFVRVLLVLETRLDAVLVPEQTLVPLDNKQIVYRIVDGKAVQTVVQTGERSAGAVEIISGLQIGDTVVTAGQTKLRDGAPVRPLTPDSDTQPPTADAP